MPRSANMTPLIAIIGGGPCGLTLARLLEMNDIDYIVFDRDTSGDKEGQGGSLDIREDSGQLALKEAGLFDDFQKLARYEDQSLKIMDGQGNLIYQREAQGKTDRPEIDRKELRTLLLNSIPPEKVRWNLRLQEVMREQDGSMTLRFTNGSTEGGFKLVVGADGAWSKVRSYVTSATPQYAGGCYLQTWISPTNSIYPTLQSQVGRGMCLVLGDNKQLIAQRMGDGTFNIYASVPVPEEWSRSRSDNKYQFHEQCRALLDKDFANWPLALTQWFQKGDGQFYNWSLYTMSVEDLSWQPTPGVALAGDAAHISTPSGEGVNCAMHDSLELSQAIIKFGTDSLDEAVAEYEKKMLPRGIELIKEAKSLKDMMHADNAAQKLKAMFTSFETQA